MNLKKILWIVLIVIVCLAAFRIMAKITGSKKVQEERVIPVEVANPKIGDVEYKISLTGDIKAETEVNVRPRTSGRVEEIYVKEGDYVKKGEKLLSFVSGISKESDIYEDMIVRAPISGLLGIQLVKEGEQIGGAPGSLNPVFVIYGINNVKIYADVPEKDYSLIKAGAEARIGIDAYPDQTFRGKISNVRPVIDPMTRTTQVEIILLNPKNMIKPGMFARVDLVLNKKFKTLVIPFDAVLGEDQKYVFVSENGAAVKKSVKLGMQEDEVVEILSGLTISDKVIVLGQRVVREGSKVEETKQ